MNKRILLSSVSIFASLALAAGATFAFFSDEGTSTGNVFSVGSLILKLSDNNETAQDTISASFGGTGLVPGGTASGQFEMQNTGTVAANHVEIAVANTNSDTTNPLDKVLEITSLTYGGVSVLGQITNANGNGYVDLGDFVADPLDDLALTDLNTNHMLAMTVTLRSEAGNEYQGGSVTSVFTVTLNQDATQ